MERRIPAGASCLGLRCMILKAPPVKNTHSRMPSIAVTKELRPLKENGLSNNRRELTRRTRFLYKSYFDF